MSRFIANVKSNGKISILNICDRDVLGRVLKDGKLEVYIDPKYFAGEEVNENEIVDLLKKHSIINLIGNDCVELAIKSGFGSKVAVRKIQGVDFLMIYKFVNNYM